VQIRKPKAEDLPSIYNILTRWNKIPYADTVFALIRSELTQKQEFNRQYFVLVDTDIILGIGGIADLASEMKTYSTKEKAGSVKTLFLNNESRGKGYGKKLLQYLEIKLKEQGNDEIILRSSKDFEPTAWDFYLKMGYRRIGTMPGHDDESEMAVFQKLI
jgi:GNAT superfamily N-acetyltransferase